jgi:hypothetical protein
VCSSRTLLGSAHAPASPEAPAPFSTRLNSPPARPPAPRSYIGASYVKWVEAAGGRVAPIRFYASDAELKRLFNSVHGLIFAVSARRQGEGSGAWCVWDGRAGARAHGRGGGKLLSWLAWPPLWRPA